MKFTAKPLQIGFLILFLCSIASAAGTPYAAGSGLPFQPGEILIYDVSWSNTINAGTMIMEVKDETRIDGKKLLHFISRAKSEGMAGALHPMNYVAQSVFDPESMQTLSYSLRTDSGRRKKSRDFVFDNSRQTVVSTENGNPPETYVVPDRVQDALSSIYYLRTLTFQNGKKAAIEVYDNGKTWTEEVNILGEERVKTAAGEFSTIKVSIDSKHEGLYEEKGKFTVWLTADSRKLPVMMRHELGFGSLIIGLREMKSPPGIHEASTGAS